MKISDLVLGSEYVIPLVVSAAVARETRTKKPFLTLSLFDGTDTISGNYWEWKSGKVPEKNTIVDVTCQVTEYLGKNQLNIKSLSVNTEKTLSDFLPTNGADIESVYSEAFNMAESLESQILRELTTTVLVKLQSLWKDAPGAKGVHHAYKAGALIHSLSVAKIAGSIADTIPEANKDLCIAGGLLHDLGKLFGYHIDGVVCDLTDEGKLFDHTFMGANFISNFVDEDNLLNSDKDEAIINLLVHIVLSHHGKLEYGAAVPPCLLEAHIVNHADGIDAAAEIIRVESSKVQGGMWTDRLWALENRPHVALQYTEVIMN